jgi:hypothetical protein
VVPLIVPIVPLVHLVQLVRVFVVNVILVLSQIVQDCQYVMVVNLEDTVSKIYVVHQPVPCVGKDNTSQQLLNQSQLNVIVVPIRHLKDKANVHHVLLECTL